MSINQKLLSKISVHEDINRGPCVRLQSYEHTNYISVVVMEEFDFESEFAVHTDKEGFFILEFSENTTMIQVQSAVSEINAYHEKEQSLYDIYL